MMYFDNAATSFPKPPCVAEAVTRAIAGFGNASRGAHPFAMAAARCVEETRAALAALFGCPSPERVAFTKNATEALNIAVASLDGHIITTEAEHNSVLRPVYAKSRYSIAPVDDKGIYGVDDIAALRRADTVAVVVAHASNVTGNVAPIAELGGWCREHGLLLIVDAAQTAGLIDIDMAALSVDALCFSGHKSLYGLQGTGGICIGERFAPRPLMTGGSGVATFEKSQPARLPALLEAGTLNAHGIAALGAGAAYVAQHGAEALREQANRLARAFVDGLRSIDGIALYGDYALAERVPVVAFNFIGVDSAEAAAELADRYGIAVRGGTHCAPLLHERFATARQGAVRFSFSHMNTADEVSAALDALAEMRKRF